MLGTTVAVFSGLLLAAAAPAPPGGVARDGKPPARELKGLPLVFFDNFDSGKAERWADTGGRPNGLRFSPDGRRLLVADTRRGLLSVDVATRTVTVFLGHGRNFFW